jgi:hypothetical protein
MFAWKHHGLKAMAVSMVGRAKCLPNNDVAKVKNSWSSTYFWPTLRRLRAVRIGLFNFVPDTAFFFIDGDRGYRYDANEDFNS